VVRMFGRITGWIFIAVAAALGGFGIYLGRVLRFNSWDAVVNPGKFYHDIGIWTANSTSSPSAIAFPVLFAAFLFVAYLMLYGLTHLSPARQMTLTTKAAKG